MSIADIKISTIDKIVNIINKAESVNQPNSRSFKTVLDEASLNTGNTSANGTVMPSKDQLIESLSKLQIQMNRHLVDALSFNKKEGPEITPSFEFGRLLLADIDLLSNRDSYQNPIMEGYNSSNNSRTNQNNDVFKVREDLDLIINQAAAAHGVEPALIKSVIKVESNFNPDSKSPKGAMGLMQLMPATAKDLGVQNAYDPLENVQAGTRYLKTLLDRYDGNVDMALAAYNWGMGNLEKKPDKIPSETKNYIENVNRYYRLAKA